MNIYPLCLQSNEVFQASYPNYLKESLPQKILKVAFDILSVIVFPIGILRYLIYKIHTFVGFYFFIPAQFLCKKQKHYLDEGRRRLFENFDTKKVTIITPDNVKLDGIYISGRDWLGRKLSNDAPLIIHYLANAGRYEDLGYRIDALKCLKRFNFLVVNYRGVSRSKSIATRKGLILDSESILEYALKKLKVPEEKIIVHGHSFGGAIATKIVANHSKLKLLNDRSFSSLEYAVYYIGKNLFHTLISQLFIIPFVLFKTVLPKKINDKISEYVNNHNIYVNKRIVRPAFLSKSISVISTVIAYFFSKFTIVLGWNFKPYLDWRKIKNKKMIVFLKKENLIPYRASLFRGVKKYEDQFICISNPCMIHSSSLQKNVINRSLNYLK